jgi:hypothetical protein
MTFFSELRNAWNEDIQSAMRRIGVVGNRISGSGISGPLSSNALPGIVYKARAFGTATQSLASNAFTKVIFNQESFDPNGNWDTSTNSRYTVPAPGKYLVAANVQMIMPASGIGILSLFKNASEEARGVRQQWGGAANTVIGLTVADVLSLASGDLIDARINFTDLTAAGTTGTIENSLNSFAIHFLST